jgi:hypothetical protein
MRSAEIQEMVYDFCLEKRSFSAPYGVLTSEQVTKQGKKYKSVTFGRARTLDAHLMIFNEKFMVLKTNRGDFTFKDVPSLMKKLEEI